MSYAPDNYPEGYDVSDAVQAELTRLHSEVERLRGENEKMREVLTDCRAYLEEHGSGYCVPTELCRRIDVVMEDSPNGA